MSEEISTPRSVPPVVEHQPAAECDLSDLRREVIESRNLVIKTDNLLKNLHAELKQMGRKQEMFESRHWMTSIVAYIIFTVLIGLGAFSLSRAEIRVAREEASANESKVHQLTLKRARAHNQRWRDVQVPYQSYARTPGFARALEGLDALEAEIQVEQRAAAQPRPHKFEIKSKS